MQHSSILIFFALLPPLVSFAGEVPAQLIGTWRLHAQSAPDDLPEQCKSIQMTYKADGTRTVVSGDLIFTEKIEVTKDGDGFATIGRPIKDNGKDNCQGRSAEYVFSHFQKETYVEVVQGMLRFYIWRKRDNSFISFDKVD